MLAIDSLHAEVDGNGGDQAGENDDAADEADRLELPPHDQAGDAPGDHGDRHRVDEERPDVAGAHTRGAAVGGVQAKEKLPGAEPVLLQWRGICDRGRHCRQGDPRQGRRRRNRSRDRNRRRGKGLPLDDHHGAVEDRTCQG